MATAAPCGRPGHGAGSGTESRRQRGDGAIDRLFLAAPGARLVGVSDSTVLQAFARLRRDGFRGTAAGSARLCGTFFGRQGVGARACGFLPGLLHPRPGMRPPLVGRPPRGGCAGQQDHGDGGEDSAFGAAAHGVNGGWLLLMGCKVRDCATSRTWGLCAARQRVRCRVTPTSMSPYTVTPLAPGCTREASPEGEAAGTPLHPASTPAAATAAPQANASRTAGHRCDPAGTPRGFITRRPGDCPGCLPARTCPRCPCRTRRAACRRRRWCACPWGLAGCGP